MRIAGNRTRVTQPISRRSVYYAKQTVWQSLSFRYFSTMASHMTQRKENSFDSDTVYVPNVTHAGHCDKYFFCSFPWS